MTKYKVALVDDEKLIRQGMKLILEQGNKIEVTNEAENGQDLLDQIDGGTFRADIILLDLSMPVLDGIDTLLEINRRGLSFNIIILTSHYNDSIILKLLDEGAAGFLAKNEDPFEVIKTVIQVGEKGFHINDYILQLIRKRRLLSAQKKLKLELTAREIEIISLICQELTNREIAEQLFISPRTVEGHRNRILEKTQCKNIAGVVIYAIEHNLFDVNISKYN
ncbi:MAG: response regulator transcription factor [Saprospiraceae bacterium]|nr:response regulator transcription factor [Saprospiraceae bacterium]